MVKEYIAEYERDLPTTWKDYLTQMGKIPVMLAWVWHKMSSDKVRKHSKIMIVLIILGTGVLMVSPWFISMIIDGLTAHDYEQVKIGFILTVASLIASIILSFASFWQREYITGESIIEVNYQTYKLFFEKSLGQHFSDSNKLTLSNVDRGKDKINEVIQNILFGGIETLLKMLFPFLGLWYIDYRAGLIITTMIATYLIVSLAMSRKIIDEGTPVDKKFREANIYAKDRGENVEWVKANAKENEEINLIKGLYTDVVLEDRKLWMWFTKFSFIRTLISSLFEITVLGYGIYQVKNGQMSIGIMYPLYYWVRQIVSSLWLVDHLERELNWKTPAILAMRDILNTPPDIIIKKDAIILPPRTPVRIEFDHVSFSYPDPQNPNKSTPVLEDICTTFELNQKVAVIGRSGEGKTTLMRLLLRYYDPTSGSIKINGIDLRDYNLQSVLRQFALVPQREEAFNGTIRYNLLYGLDQKQAQEKTNEDLWHLMKSLQIDFGKRLHDGLDTEIGRRGIKLSGGEVQRLITGAAAAKEPIFMVIDEATSSLDSITEKQVQNGLINLLQKDIGALIIAHRLSTIRFCDKFIMIESNGDLKARITAEATSFCDLANQSNTFKELCELQFIEV